MESIGMKASQSPAGNTIGEESTRSLTSQSSYITNLIAEIKEHYGSYPPPFITHGKRHQPGEVNSVVLAAEDGRYPQAPVKRVDLIHRRWDDHSTFSTLELDGSSHIVKSMSGGCTGNAKGGAAIRLWEGPHMGFSKLCIAFPDKGPMAAVTGKRKATTSPRLVAPSTDPPQKRILRASKPLRASDVGVIYNWTDPHDNDFPPSLDARQASERKVSPKNRLDERKSEGACARRTNEKSTEDSSSSESSESSEDLDPFLTSRSRPSIKASHSLLTPRNSVSRAGLSAGQRNSEPVNSATAQSPPSFLTPDEIDKLVFQLKEEGKSFHDIRDHMDKMTGQTTTRNTWSSRYYNRILKKGTTASNAARSNSTFPLKEADEITETLIRLRAEGKTWKIIGERMRDMTGQASPSSTWASRYYKLDQIKPKRGQRPVRDSKEPRRRKSDSGQEEDKVDVEDESPRHRFDSARDSQDHKNKTVAGHRKIQGEHFSTEGLRPTRLRTVNSSFDPTSPLYFGVNDTKMPEASSKPAIQYESILSPHKFNRTVLRISHSGAFTPLKLRSCPTMSDLFNSVLSVCGMTDRPNNVEALRAIFTWLPADDGSRTMLLKKDFEDSFEFLLETVDEAPCWETENGKCTVSIELVLHNITGEPLQNRWVGQWPASDAR